MKRVMLVAVVSCIIIADSSRAGSPHNQAHPSDSATWKVEGDSVFIEYQFNGEFNEWYEVQLVLLHEKDRRLRIVPRSVSGDVGETISDGKRKVIRWYIRGDIDLQSLRADDNYYFQILIERAGGFPWTYAAIGAVSGGALLYLLLNRPGESGTSGPQPLPEPPQLP